MPSIHLSNTTIDLVREQLKEGRSMVKVAQDLAVSLCFDIENAFSVVMQIANYEPTVPDWHMGSHIQTHDRLVTVKRVFQCPSILLLDNVLSDEECEEIKRRALPELKGSVVATRDESQKTDTAARRSETAYLTRGMDDFIRKIDQRCSDIMHAPVEWGEHLQVVRYQPGGEYRPHYDFFPIDRNADTARALKLRLTGGNRTATLLMYLNDVEEGGETFFPGLGLAVKPSKGAAIYFHYTDGQGRFDPQTLHGGAPVVSGEKWIVTKWIRQGPHEIL